MDNEVFVFEDFLDLKSCESFFVRIHDHWREHRHEENDGLWRNKSINITNEPITEHVKQFLEKKFNIKLTCQSTNLCTWPKDTWSELHIHTENDRQTTDFNSVLYLNDNFEGGEFYTNQGFELKPKPGTLTFFNGQKIWHGVRTIKDYDRFNIVFWWTNTQFNLCENNNENTLLANL